jgi:hypothetical protein
MTLKTQTTFDKFHALQMNHVRILPKTGQYVATHGQCFNAATTDIIRTAPKAGSR